MDTGSTFDCHISPCICLAMRTGSARCLMSLCQLLFRGHVHQAYQRKQCPGRHTIHDVWRLCGFSERQWRRTMILCSHLSRHSYRLCRFLWCTQFINWFRGRLISMRLRLFEVCSCVNTTFFRRPSDFCRLLDSFSGSMSPNVQWRHSTCNDLCTPDTLGEWDSAETCDFLDRVAWYSQALQWLFYRSYSLVFTYLG